MQYCLNYIKLNLLIIIYNIGVRRGDAEYVIASLQGQLIFILYILA